MDNKSPTKEQIGQIVALLVAEKVTFDEAQAFIMAHRDQMSLKKSRPYEAWEKAFPGKGSEIMSFLAPFYRWRPQLKFALPELRRRAKEAVFWKKFGDVRVSRASEAPELRSWGSLWETVKEQYLYEHPHYCALDNMMDSELFNWLHEIRDPAYISLKASLMVPCMLVLEGKPEEAAKFRPLVDMWLDGNFPIGFDISENLVVLVAE